MNDQDSELFEAELRRLPPARPPEELLTRLAAAAPGASELPEQPATCPGAVSAWWKARISEAWTRIVAMNRPKVGTLGPGVRTIAFRESTSTDARGRASLPAAGGSWKRLRLWIPITAAAATIAVLVWRWPIPQPPPERPIATAPNRPVLEADGIEFGQQLLAAYDAVARMPGGEPVRFRCREWMDELVLRDSTRGVVFEQRRPRLEVVPVCFEMD